MSSQTSRLRLLHAIRQAQPISRTDLAISTGFSMSTVSAVTNDLIELGLLVEKRVPRERPGRPRIELSINSDAALVAGVDLSVVGRIEVQVANLEGDAQATASRPIDSMPRGADLLDEIVRALEDVAKAGKLSVQDIRAVGISLPAMVDTEAGILHWLPPHAPKAEPIAQSLEARLGRPVFIDNLANVMARNERWFGGGTDFPDLTVIVVGLGLGLGQYVDGAIRSGAHGFNPEFSHVKIGGGPDLPCPCGGIGCLAMVASIGAITSRATSASPSMIQLDRLFDQFEVVAAQARAGDARSIALFDDAGQMLGAAIANHINVWDPDKILLAVRHPAWIELVEGPLLRRIERDTLPPLRGRAVVAMKVVAQEGHARGAAALVIERLYGG